MGDSAALLMTALSTVMNTVGQVQAAKQERQVAEFNAAQAEQAAEWAEFRAAEQAKVARSQAEFAEYNAAMARKEAADKAAKSRVEARRLLATQAARYSKSGLLLTGTPLEVMAQTAIESEYDSLLLEHQGAVEAWNYEEQARTRKSEARAYEIEGAGTASAARSKAALNLMKGNQARSTGIFQAGSTLLTGAMKMADMRRETSTGSFLKP